MVATRPVPTLIEIALIVGDGYGLASDSPVLAAAIEVQDFPLKDILPAVHSNLIQRFLFT